MRIISTAKIVTETEKAEKPHIIQLENHKWVTIIKTVKAHNFTI